MTRRFTLVLQSAVCTLAVGGAFIAGRVTGSLDSVNGNDRKNAQILPGITANSPPGSKKNADGPEAGKNGGSKEADAGTTGRITTAEQAAARVKAIFDQQDPVARMTDYLAFLKTLKDNDSRSAALGAMLENFNPRERGRELQMLMTQWGAADPAAALASVKERKDWIGGMAANMVLGNWAQKNPDQAIAWATENGKEAATTEDGNRYLVGVLGGLAKTDLARAATLAETMPRSNARGEVMDRVLDQYFAQRSPDAARDWVSGLQDSPFKNGLLGKLAGRLADKDATSAASWASTLPDSEAKPYVLSQVVERWSKDQPNEAGAWLNQFPPSASTDQPRETFAWQVQKEDPEAALAWAGTITDERRRSKTTRDLVRTWAEREPAAARQWISSNLPAEARQRFGNRQPNG
ncbi:MAG: hypothetical protein V4726_18025 [Verrucomicrobiota bacterium]